MVNCSKAGTIRSTGCKACVGTRTRTHGYSVNRRPTPLYCIWSDMRKRCQNPKANNYPNYGGRGISVCERWDKSVVLFVEDVGPRPDNAELDRIDNNGNYEPGNVRWATRTQNQNNKRNNRTLTYKGETMTGAEWARRIGCQRKSLMDRILLRGMSIEDAIETPFDIGATRRKTHPPRWLITHNGETLTCKQWAKKLGIGSGAIYGRLKKGWDPVRALTEPVEPRAPRKRAM
jgi:hypothetical protein